MPAETKKKLIAVIRTCYGSVTLLSTTCTGHIHFGKLSV